MSDYKVQHIDLLFGKYTVVSRLNYYNGEFPLDFEFAVAFCSPKDTFNKKFGVALAYERLQNKDPKFYRTVPITNNKKPDYRSLRNLVTAILWSTIEIPRWGTFKY